jgi:pimeloyl-ACP methyl ester carboxylesterase
MSQLHKIATPTGTPRGTAIFVHGLGGDAFGTWRAKPDEDAFWPRWLAQDVPGLAVFSVGYPAAVLNWQGTSMPLQDRAGNVLEGLLVDLEQLYSPIVFICHSLGGLVVKQLLRKASDMKGRPEAADFLRRVRGVVFMATPHTGSQLANVLSLFKTVFRVSSATESLIKNDPALRDLNTWYRDWSQEYSIKHRVFFETISLHGVTTVDPGSADPGLSKAQPIAIDADHIQICKPESREVLIYKSTRDFISRIMQSPPTTSDSAISVALQKKHVAMMAPKPPADFVQRPLEFEALKKKLLSAKGDAVAVTAALRGAGGYGKTTLAKALAHDPDVQIAYSDGVLFG